MHKARRESDARDLYNVQDKSRKAEDLLQTLAQHQFEDLCSDFQDHDPLSMELKLSPTKAT
jgi:hypothetical protein